jgi:hypothetical protein
MFRIDDNELVFAFPEVNASAELRVSFRRADPPEERVSIADPIDGGLPLATGGRLVMHLRPKFVHQESYWTGTQTIRYPFAVLVTVAGMNALTGEPSKSLSRAPQNYFASPPQGGIDGYFVRGVVHPFRGGGELPQESTRLDLKVFPMKSETWAALMDRRRMSGWGPAAISGLTLPYGGERQCEPVYEDLCCFGDWDQSRGESATVWLRRS